MTKRTPTTKDYAALGRALSQRQRARALRQNGHVTETQREARRKNAAKATAARIAQRKDAPDA
jgi:hypothetical protein